MTPILSDLDIVLRLLLAALLGGAIGFERERLVWAAGLRTHMLVSVGACLIIIVSAYGFSDVIQAYRVVLDPSRIAAQVVSGIGFLGAGTILLRGEVVKGLTTAASLWAVAAVGLAAGAGMFVAGIAATAILLIILAGLKPLEERFRSRTQTSRLRIIAERRAVTIDVLRDASAGYASRIRCFVVEPFEDRGQDEIIVEFYRLPSGALQEIARKLHAAAGVIAAGEAGSASVGHVSQRA
jgi:putative Mg2+ transporter-C (MgtC) family protein